MIYMYGMFSLEDTSPHDKIDLFCHASPNALSPFYKRTT